MYNGNDVKTKIYSFTSKDEEIEYWKNKFEETEKELEEYQVAIKF